MKSKCLKIGILVVITVIIIGMLGACTKEKDDNAQASLSGTKAPIATSAKTATGTVAKSVQSTSTASKDSAVSTAEKNNEGSGSDRLTSNDNSDSIDGNDDGGGDSNIISENESAGDIADYEIPETDEEPLFDLGGRTLVYAPFNLANTPRDTEDASIDMQTVYELIKRAEEKYNFKMEIKADSYTTPDYYNFVITQGLAGIKFADFLPHTTHAATIPFIKNNIIIPLDEYIDFDEPIMKANKSMKITEYWGKHYGIIWYNTLTLGTVQYNKDLLDREGQPDIIELYKNNNWNWSTFLDILIACTKDTNGDGITDQWGLSASSNTDFVNKIVHSNGVASIQKIDGKYIFNYYTPQGQRALQFVSDLAHVYKVFKTSGQALYRKGQVAINLSDSYNNATNLKVGINSLTAPPPKGPDMKEYVRVSASGNIISVHSLCDIPREAAIIAKEISILWQEDGSHIPIWTEKFNKMPKPWELANRIAQTEREYFISNIRKDIEVVADYVTAFGLSTQINSIATGVLNGDNIFSLVESRRAEIEAIVDEYNDYGNYIK